MKRILFLAASLFLGCYSQAQPLQPMQMEIYDPFGVASIHPASVTSDASGNTYLSTEYPSHYSGVMKLAPNGNILWQKKLPYMFSPNEHWMKVDEQNIVHKADGLYVATSAQSCSACSNVSRFLSKCDPSTGTFAWHLEYLATDDQGSKSIILKAPVGVYWIHGTHVFNISPSGTVLFVKRLNTTVTSAVSTPDGTVYLSCNDWSTGNAIAIMYPSGHIARSWMITDGSGTLSTPDQIAYDNGNIFLNYGGYGSGPSCMIKMDTLGTILASKKWTNPVSGGGSMGSSTAGGTYIIYKNRIVYSHGSAGGPILNFVRLNTFSVMDMNLNELQTFCYPHYSTYDGGYVYTMGPFNNSPEVMNINNNMLQIFGNKGESSFKSVNFMRLDSTLMFKGCGLIPDTLLGYSSFPLTAATSNITDTAVTAPVNSIFPSTSTSGYLSSRNDLSIDSIPTMPVYCGQCNSAALAFTSGDAAVVYYDWGAATGGQTSNPAVNLCPGLYHLTVMDNYGCKDTASFPIQTTPPPSMGLCLTTVDTTSSFNVLLWEKPVSTTLAGFNIYREITTNNFQVVGFVPYDSLSEYNDSLANPNITNYRYKITALDTCGFESEQSDFHSTIHLQLLGSGNMQWTLYDIEHQPNPVSFYNIYRDNLSDGNWTLLTGSLPGTNSTYTDLNYTLYPAASYRVDVNWGLSCTPTRATVNTSRSNIKHNGLAIGITEAAMNNAWTMQPNPATNDLNIKLSNLLGKATLRINNLLGQTVFEMSLPESSSSTTELNVDVSSFAKGIYTVSVENEQQTSRKKLVVN